MKPEPAARGVSLALVWSGAALAAALGAGCAALLVMHLLPRGHPDVWVWPLRTEVAPFLPWTLPAGLAVVLVTLLALDTLRTGKTPSRASCAVLVTALTVGSGTLMAAMMLDDREYPLRAPAAVLGDMSMGYYLQAARMDDPREFMRDIPARTTPGAVPERVSTQPPGRVLYAVAARDFISRRPALRVRLQRTLEIWGGDAGLVGTTALSRRVSTMGPSPTDVVLAFWPLLLITFSAPLVVPLAYGVGAVTASPRAGLAAAALAAAIPSLLCFNPSVDALTAVAAAGIVLLWALALRSGSMTAAVAGGVLWAGGLFWTFGIAALVIPLAVMGMVASRGRGMKDVLRLGLGMGAGLGAAWLTGWIAAGYNPVTSMTASLEAQRHIMEVTGRPYGLSLVWNLYDFALFAGPPLVLMALLGTVWAAMRSPRSGLAAAVGLGVVLMVLTLTLWGGTRGEVGRIWGLVMPLLAVPAAVPLLTLRGWSLMSAGTLLVAAQVALTVAIHTRLLLVAP